MFRVRVALLFNEHKLSYKVSRRHLLNERIITDARFKILRNSVFWTFTG